MEQSTLEKAAALNQRRVAVGAKFTALYSDEQRRSDPALAFALQMFSTAISDASEYTLDVIEREVMQRTPQR